MSAVDSVTLLKSFAEAGNALEELPKVKADLEAAHSLIDETNEKLTKEQNHTADLNARIAALEAELSAKEAALSDATKSHSESQKLLSGLRDMLGLNSVAHSAVQPQDVAAQAEAEAQPQPQAAPAPAPEAPSAPFAEAHTQASTESQPGVSAPTQAPVDTPQTNSGHSDAEAGQSALGKPSSTSATTSELPSDANSTGVASQADVENTQSSADRLRYNNQQPWQKPADITWRTFREGGGSVGYWVHDVDTF